MNAGGRRPNVAVVVLEALGSADLFHVLVAKMLLMSRLVGVGGNGGSIGFE